MDVMLPSPRQAAVLFRETDLSSLEISSNSRRTPSISWRLANLFRKKEGKVFLLLCQQHLSQHSCIWTLARSTTAVQRRFRTFMTAKIRMSEILFLTLHGTYIVIEADIYQEVISGKTPMCKASISLDKCKDPVHKSTWEISPSAFFLPVQ